MKDNFIEITIEIKDNKLHINLWKEDGKKDWKLIKDLIQQAIIVLAKDLVDTPETAEEGAIFLARSLKSGMFEIKLFPENFNDKTTIMALLFNALQGITHDELMENMTKC